jgi:cytochrome c553
MLRDGAILGAGGGSPPVMDGGLEADGSMLDMQAPPPPDTPTYAQLCAPCHGATGEGGTGPALTGLADADRAALTDRIARTMPPTAPEQCTGDCAVAMANLIIDTLSEPADACDAVGATPRRLRLLTPREYARTVTDLFFVAPDATDCERHTFTLADVDAGRVHVAGSFNDWAPTVADGGWPLQRDGDGWRLDTAIPPGRHVYKFVLDEQTWIADPRNPLGEDDGFGGRNSVIDIAACPEDGPPPGLIAGLPAPTRPEGFFFDTHADSGRVTAVHFEGYLAAAERVARAAFANPDPWLGCNPQAPDCVQRFVQRAGRRVFRRPLDADEQARYAALFTERSPQVALTAMLMSPHFLYRSERGQPSNDGHFRLTRYELATALAYLFWGTTPDDALLDTPLETPEQIATTARAMLADPRARDMVGEFAVQWLGVGALGTISKSPELEPDFGRAVRAALLDETRTFVADAVAEGGRYADLVTAHTDPPAALAALYGDADRTGVQGLGSVLATYAHSDQTSPIRRGLFVRTHLLCQPLPPPPPNAGGVPDVDPNATTRERFAQHTADAFCASCHQHIDPVGFGFERYDPIGRWRDTENGQPVDAAGDMTNVEGLGTQSSAPFDRLDALGDILAGSQAAPACFAIQLQRFALGRTEGPADRCAVRGLTTQFAESGGDLQQLWVDLVSAPAFYTRVEAE